MYLAQYAKRIVQSLFPDEKRGKKNCKLSWSSDKARSLPFQSKVLTEKTKEVFQRKEEGIDPLAQRRPCEGGQRRKQHLLTS